MTNCFHNINKWYPYYNTEDVERCTCGIVNSIHNLLVLWQYVNVLLTRTHNVSSWSYYGILKSFQNVRKKNEGPFYHYIMALNLLMPITVGLDEVESISFPILLILYVLCYVISYEMEIDALGINDKNQ